MLEVSVQHGVLRAALGTEDPKSDVILLTTMAVKKSSRKHGIGTALLAAAEQWIRSVHPEVACAALFVYRNNHDAIRYAALMNQAVEYFDPQAPA